MPRQSLRCCRGSLKSGGGLSPGPGIFGRWAAAAWLSRPSASCLSPSPLFRSRFFLQCRAVALRAKCRAAAGLPGSPCPPFSRFSARPAASTPGNLSPGYSLRSCSAALWPLGAVRGASGRPCRAGDGGAAIILPRPRRERRKTKDAGRKKLMTAPPSIAMPRRKVVAFLPSAICLYGVCHDSPTTRNCTKRQLLFCSILHLKK